MRWDKHKLPLNCTLTVVANPSLPFFSWMQATVTLHYLSTFVVPWQRKLQQIWQRTTFITEFSVSSDLYVYALRKSRNTLGNHCSIYNLALQSNFGGSGGKWKESQGMNSYISDGSLKMMPHFPLLIPSSHSDVTDSNMKTNIWSRSGALPKDGEGRNKAIGRKWKVSQEGAIFLAVHAQCLPFYHMQTQILLALRWI